MTVQTHALVPRTVALDAVDWKDETFLLRYGREPGARLEDSLRRTGVHNPPLLKQTQNAHSIVYGFERLRVWRALGNAEVQARVAPPGASDSDLFIAAVEDNLEGRGLNPVEEAMVLEKLKPLLEPRRLIEEILPLLGRKPSPAILDRILSCRTQGPIFQRALARGDLDEGAAELLKPFRPEEREIAVECMLALRMSAGARRDLARQALEICRRDELDLGTLLGELGFQPSSDQVSNEGEDQSSPSPPEFDVPTLRARLLDALRRRRYPLLSTLESQYAARHAELGLADAVKIRPPKDFEGRRYRLEARLENLEDLRKTVESLRDCLENHSDSLRKIFEIPYPK